MSRRGGSSWTVVVAVAAMLLGGSPARSAELSAYQEDKLEEQGKARQLTPYLDRWKTADTDTILKDPNVRSRYQGDLPFYGDWLFLNLDLVLDGFYKHRENPDFRRGDATQTFHEDNDFRRFIGLYGFELRNADDVFKPATWRARFIGASEWDQDFNARDDTASNHHALQEAFVEHQVFDLGELDLSFVRLGVEPFRSDFHGLVFFDNALSARLFGEYRQNRYRYNLAVFRPFVKDVHSNLNDLGETPDDRYIGLASLAINDVTPGWNAEFSLHVDHDREAQGAPKDADAYYVGSTFNGRVGQVNFNPATYLVVGQNEQKDSSILAGLFLLDVAYNLPAADFVTMRGSYLFQSGDGDPSDDEQHGFAAINDNVALFGAGASYWTGEAIFFNRTGERNGGTQLVKANSALTEPGNFDAPGLHLLNVGTLVKLTQRLDGAMNLNYLRFAETDGIAEQVGRADVDGSIGFDLNGLLEWRPFLQNNFLIDVAGSVLFPGSGFEDVVGDGDTVFAFTTDVRFIY